MVQKTLPKTRSKVGRKPVVRQDYNQMVERLKNIGVDAPPYKSYLLMGEDGRRVLKKIVEKPKKFIGNLINTGLYKFTPEIFEKIKKIKISKRGEYELTDAINLLAKEKKVKVKKIKDYWFDFGNPADIIKISRFLNNEKRKKICYRS